MIGRKFYKDDLDQEAYAEAARWCNTTHLGYITEFKDYYEVVEVVEDPRCDIEREIDELEDWFVNYDKQVMQYIRAQRQGVEWDGDIEELDSQADENAAMLNKLRQELDV